MSRDYSFHLLWFYNMQVGKNLFSEALSVTGANVEIFLLDSCKWTYAVFGYSARSRSRKRCPLPAAAAGSDPRSDESQAELRLRWAAGAQAALGAGGWGTDRTAALSQPSSHDPWPCRLLVLASPPLRGINGVFPGIRGILHRGTPMSWRRDPSVHCFKRLGRILWMAKR